jgi:PPOX class probable FMN-dependent enzyme
MASYVPLDVVTSEDQIRSVIPKQFTSQTGKVLNHIDDLIRVWIERSPFVSIATFDEKGRVDVAPKGDPAGFVKVLDQHSLAIPDRPGNHRFDTFANILATGRIGLMFMVPNRNEVVRVNGSAQILRDPALRESMAVNDRVPEFAILVQVEEAFYHCGKAVLRSKLWQPEEAAPIDGLPSYGAALKVHAELPEALEEVEGWMKSNEVRRMYDE